SVNTEELEQAVNDYGNTDRDKYTNSSLVDYDVAYDNAVYILNNVEDYDQETVDDATETLNAAKDNLVERADTTKLEALLDAHKELLDEDYIKEVEDKIASGLGEYDLEKLTKEVEDAINEAGGDVEIGKEEVERAIEIIEESVSNIEDVEDLDSYDEYVELLESIKEVLDSDDDEDVDYGELRNQLIAAYENLLNESVDGDEGEDDEEVDEQEIIDSLTDTTELEQAVTEAKGNLDRLNGEAEELYELISELENKGTVTEEEKAEYDSLVEQYNEKIAEAKVSKEELDVSYDKLETELNNHSNILNENGITESDYLDELIEKKQQAEEKMNTDVVEKDLVGVEVEDEASENEGVEEEDTESVVEEDAESVEEEDTETDETEEVEDTEPVEEDIESVEEDTETDESEEVEDVEPVEEDESNETDNAGEQEESQDDNEAEEEQEIIEDESVNDVVGESESETVEENTVEDEQVEESQADETEVEDSTEVEDQEE